MLLSLLVSYTGRAVDREVAYVSMSSCILPKFPGRPVPFGKGRKGSKQVRVYLYYLSRVQCVSELLIMMSRIISGFFPWKD